MPVDDVVWKTFDANFAGIAAKFAIPSRITACTGDGGIDVPEKTFAQFPSASPGEVKCGTVQFALRFVIPCNCRHAGAVVSKLRQQLAGLAHNFRMWDSAASAIAGGLDAAVNLGTPCGAEFRIIGCIHALNETGGDAGAIFHRQEQRVLQYGVKCGGHGWRLTGEGGGVKSSPVSPVCA